MEAQKKGITVDYQSIELFPLNQSITECLNYPGYTTSEMQLFRAMHDAIWNTPINISPQFRLTKIEASLLSYTPSDAYDLVYFDAFSPVQQPELWTEHIFGKLYAQMTAGGILTTYCAKGIVRRTMKQVGFKTERLPGPPMKREMLRAVK